MKELQLAQKWLVQSIVFLIPLFFLPLTADFFEFNKMFLLAFGAVLGVLFWALTSSRGEFKIRFTSFDLPILAFGAVVILSSWIVTPNKLDAFVFPGTSTMILSATLFYFILTQYLRRETQDDANLYKTSPLIYLFLVSVSVASVFALLSGVRVFSLFAKILSLPDWFAAPQFNTLGGPLAGILVFVAILPIVLERVVKKIGSNQVVNVLLLVSIISGLAVSIFYVLPGKDTALRILPFSTGWSIVLETLKQNPLLGIGSGNFVEAFNRFRPVDFNSTDFWNFRFGVSSNWYLHIWTTMGLLGIVSFVWIGISILGHLRKVHLRGYHYSLVLCLILFLLFPGTLPLIFAFYLLLAHLASPQGRDVSLQFAATQTDPYGSRQKTNFLPGFIALVSLAGLLVGGYYASRVYAADMNYRQGLVAVSKNDAQNAYTNFAKAIQANPYVDFYRATFSQTNLAIANSMGSNQNINDADRQTVAQLVQQAIREGQAAVANNQRRSQNWETLAQVYRALIPAAKGADQYAVSAFQQAILLDPVNPAPRVSLGGVFYTLKDYESAVRVFELAVSTKPNFANAHYNLAIALREKGDLARAAQEMAQALNLTDRNTAGYETAKKEFDELQKKVAEKTATASGQIKEDSGSMTQTPLQNAGQQSKINTPLVLSPDAAPPATDEAEPSPIPAPTVSPSASPVPTP